MKFDVLKRPRNFPSLPFNKPVFPAATSDLMLTIGFLLFSVHPTIGAIYIYEFNRNVHLVGFRSTSPKMYEFVILECLGVDLKSRDKFAYDSN